MICQHCGQEVSKDRILFCDHCGSQIWRGMDPGLNQPFRAVQTSGYGGRTDHMQPVNAQSVNVQPGNVQSGNVQSGNVQQGYGLPDLEQSSPAITFGKTVLLFLAGFVTISLICTAMLFVINLIKTPKQSYMLSELQSAAASFDSVKKAYDDISHSFGLSQTAPYEDKWEFSINTPPDSGSGSGFDSGFNSSANSDFGAGADPFAQIEKLIQNIKMTSDSVIDPMKKQMAGDFVLSIAQNPFLKGKYMKDGSRIGLALPDIYNKYFFLDRSDLNSVYRNLGISDDNLPNKLIDTQELKNAISIRKADLYAEGLTYARLFYNGITDKQITYSRNANFSVNGENVKCDQYVITFDEKQIRDFVKLFCDKLAGDDKLFDIFYGNFLNVLKVYEDAGYLKSSAGTIDLAALKDVAKVRDGFRSGLNDFIESFDSTKFPNGLKMTVWVRDTRDLAGLLHMNSQVIGREIDFTGQDAPVQDASTQDGAAQDGAVRTEFMSKFGNISGVDSKNSIFQLKLSFQVDGKAVGNMDLTAKVQSAFDKAQNAEKGKSTIDLTLPSDRLNASTDFKISRDASTGNRSGSYDFTVTDSGADNTAIINTSGKLMVISSSNKKDKSTSKEYDLNINNLDSSGIPSINGAVAIGIKNTVTRGVKFEMPVVADFNKVDLNNASKHEFDDAIQQLVSAIQNYLANNQTLFGKFIG